MNKQDIIAHLNSSHSSFWETASLFPTPTISVNGKWSVGQNVQHINIRLFRLSPYLALPKSSIAIHFGLSGRAAKHNEVMTKVFRNALENGVPSTDSFFPDENLTTSLEELELEY